MVQENSAPLSESARIVIAGLANSGKSSLFNAIFKKDVAVVSDQEGTTTDPVTRKIELKNLGPCAVTDTAGLCDSSALGEARLEKTRERISQADIVILATSAKREIDKSETELLAFLKEKKIPFFGAVTFCAGEVPSQKAALFLDCGFVALDLADRKEAVQNKVEGLLALVESKAGLLQKEPCVMDGLAREGSLVVLVAPIDKEAPKGRLILPQAETIRDLLDKNCPALVTTPQSLGPLLDSLKRPPDLVVTDSQAFKEVAEILPQTQALTSFSILFARKKGDLKYFMESLKALDSLRPDSKICVMEACSHHMQDDDIGTVKIPAILKKRFGENLKIFHSKNLSEAEGADLAIHCGACAISRRETLSRLEFFKERKIPVLNYGIFLAWANGLIPRAVEMFL